MHLPTLTSLALGLGLVSANSGFYSTCHNYHPVAPQGTPKRFTADCKTQKGIYNIDVTLSIDRCFANDCGRLVARYNGGFGGSCKSLDRKGSVLWAQCKNCQGNYVSTSIDLNQHIGNIDGYMYCFNQRALE